MQKIYITSNQNKLFLLNKLRNNNDLSSLVMSINELKKNIYFDYDDETLFYIVNHYHTTREIAQTYVEAMYYLNDNLLNEKMTFINNLRLELINNNLLIFKPLFREWLKNYELCFYHIPLNNLVSKLINDCSLITTVNSENIIAKERKITYFKALDIREEVSNICLEIVSLIKSGIPYNKIYLTNLNEEYQKMFLTYGKIFNLTFVFNNFENVYSTKIVKYFVEHLEEDWLVVLDDIKKMVKTPLEERVYNALVNFANNNLLFKDNIDYIKEVIKNISIKSLIYKEAIKEFNFKDSEVEEDAYIFLVNANESFPNLVKNYEYLTDQDRISLNLLSILEENKFIMEDALTKLNYYSNLIVSYCATDDGKFYPSTILNNCHLKEIQILPNYQHSSLYNKLVYARNMDIYYEYGIWENVLNTLYPTYKTCNYRSFNHLFQKFNIPPIKTLSYSSLDIFNRCPFRFYLANILKLKNNESTFFQNIGTFYHHLLEQFYKPNFNFKELVLEEEANFQNSKKEEFFFKKLTNNLARLLDEIKRQEAYSNLKNVLCEVKIEVLLDYDIVFKGFIDKFYYDDNKVVVIDYKTGNPHIDFNLINYGIGMQLPIYAYLLSQSEFKDYELVGFYLQKVIPSLIVSDLKHQKEELLAKEYYLEGYSTTNEESLKEFDASYKDSKVIKGLKKSSKGFYAYSKVMSEDNIKKMNLFTEEIIKNSVLEIVKGNFDIAPKNIGNKNVGCEFCPYGSICNYDGNDVVYEKLVKPQFLGGEDDELVKDAVTSN